MQLNNDNPVVAVDLGGTKVVAALVSASGEIMARERRATEAGRGPEVVIDHILNAIDAVLEPKGLKAADLFGVSVAAAGPVDMEKGLVTTSPNLPGWYAVPLRDLVRTRYGVDSFLINDAKAAVVGEHQFGVGKGVDNLVCVTLGTGVGGGIIANGHLYLGKSGGAGEVGHMTIDVNGPKCACGNIGCWEVFASGTAMARETIRRLSAGERSSLSETFAGRLAAVTAVDVAEAARAGDAFALSVVAWSARYLGAGLTNLVDIFNPEMIVIGGGMSKMSDLLLEPAKKVVGERAFPLLSHAVSILPSSLGDDAGVLGAAAFAFQKGRI